MAAIMKCRHLPRAATCLAVVFATGIVARSQPSGLTITLAGQSMIRSDLRVTAADAVPVIASLLRGDVIFTNFEAVVTEPGQPNDSTPETRQTAAGSLRLARSVGCRPWASTSCLSRTITHGT